MFILKHLKTLQRVSIIIQIIFRELVCSLLKSLILKFVKNVKSQCGDAAAKVYQSSVLTLPYTGRHPNQIHAFNFPWSSIRYCTHSGSSQPESKLGHPVRMATLP